MTYEELLIEADSQNLIVREKNIPGYDGRIYKNRVAIHKGLTSVEKSCTLAEELGHHYTSSGNILDQSDTTNRKQEYRARIYGYNLKIGLMGIIRSYERGCSLLHEMAEYLDVTEKFLKEALSAYKKKYGIYVTVDNYIIYFEPTLCVVKLNGHSRCPETP